MSRNKIELKEEYVESMDFVGSIKENVRGKCKKNTMLNLGQISASTDLFLIKIDPLRTKADICKYHK